MHDTTGNSRDTFTRRNFISRTLSFTSLAATAPFFLEQSARAMTMPLGSLLTSQAGVPEDRILVVVQLGGGNDGLNTVVPYGNRAYYNARPQIAIPAPRASGDGALTIDGADGIGLHPNLSGLKALLDDGVAGIVQGVGYPNPNRSHFTSMDIWQTANESGHGSGWIGRYFDHECQGTPQPEGAIAIGRTAPHALIGNVQKPVSFESADLFRWVGKDLDESLAAPYGEIQSKAELGGVDAGSQLGFLTRTALDAQVSSDRIRKAVARPTEVRFPGTKLAQQLQLVSAMIRANLATRVYYVSLGGFDTHANQLGGHNRLMGELGGALKAFYDEMKAQGNNSRVLTMVFSEFGRRVAQNSSGGTDHGTAAPMYLVGDMVRPGLLGEHPSLTKLDEGDLMFNVDFRSIYATLLDDWMGAPSATVLGGQYKKAQVLK